MGSDKYICVRETTCGNIVLIDVTGKQTKPSWINIEADSSLVNPNSEFLAVKGRLAITTCWIAVIRMSCAELVDKCSYLHALPFVIGLGNCSRNCDNFVWFAELKV